VQNWLLGLQRFVRKGRRHQAAKATMFSAISSDLIIFFQSLLLSYHYLRDRVGGTHNMSGRVRMQQEKGRIFVKAALLI
jgi:hypothetical protein